MVLVPDAPQEHSPPNLQLDHMVGASTARPLSVSVLLSDAELLKMQLPGSFEVPVNLPSDRKSVV